MPTRKQLVDRSVIVTGIPQNEDVQDVINTLVAKARVKKPVSIVFLDNMRIGPRYVILLLGKNDRKKLMTVVELKYKGKSYAILLQASTEDDIPEAWSSNPPDFKYVLSPRSETVTTRQCSDMNTQNLKHENAESLGQQPTIPPEDTHPSSCSNSLEVTPHSTAPGSLQGTQDIGSSHKSSVRDINCPQEDKQATVNKAEAHRSSVHDRGLNPGERNPAQILGNTGQSIQFDQEELQIALIQPQTYESKHQSTTFVPEEQEQTPQEPTHRSSVQSTQSDPERNQLPLIEGRVKLIQSKEAMELTQTETAEYDEPSQKFKNSDLSQGSLLVGPFKLPHVSETSTSGHQPVHKSVPQTDSETESETMKNTIGVIKIQSAAATEPSNLNKSHVLVHQKEYSQAAPESRSETPDDGLESCTIEVEGFNKGKTDENVKNYFENTRRSGGMKVRGHWRIADVVFVTFSTPEEVQRVLGREHKVDGRKLILTRHIPKPSYKNRILVSNLRNTTTKERLKNYLEAKSWCRVMSIAYGEQPGVALVSFYSEKVPDLHKLRDNCKDELFEGSAVEISTVPISDSIVVQGVGPDTTEDDLTHYFEHNRSGNELQSEVTVTMHRDEGFSLVQFKNYKVVDAILGKEAHKIGETVLSVSLYIECLGIRPPEDNQPWYQQPEAFTVESLNKYKCMFLHQSKKDQRLKIELAGYYTEITWMSEDTVTLKCTLTSETSDAVRKAKEWKRKADDCLVKFFDQIIVKDVTTLSQVWEDVHTKLELIDTSNTEAIMCISETKPQVVIAGYAADVTQLVQDIETIVKNVVDEFNRKKQEITETVDRLKPISLRLLNTLGFSSDMMKQHKDLMVAVDLKQNTITFKGQAKDVSSAIGKMCENVDKFCFRDEAGLSEAKLLFLKQTEVKDFIMNKMKESNLLGVWETEKSKLTVHSTSEEDVLAVAKLIQDVVVEHTEVLQAESASLLSSVKWSQLVADIRSSHGKLVNINTHPELNTVTFVVIHTIAATIRAQIQDFFEENSIYSCVIKLPKPIFRFLMMHREGDIKRTAESISQYNGKLEFSDRPLITVCGRKEGLDEAVRTLTRFAKNVVNQKYTIRRAGIGKYIQSDKIRGAITETEKSDRCVIELEHNESEGVMVESRSPDRSPALALHHGTTDGALKNAARCSIGHGRQIDVVMGDMTTMKVDVIVNAANDRLDHVGGLAKVIADRGGPDIQRESNAYIAKHKEVPVGNAVSTGPGRLPCKMVVHAVGPVWHDGNQGEEKLLKSAVMCSMECADRKGFKSIVLPTLSAGIFGYPIEKATKHIVEAIEKFYTMESPNSRLEIVYLVDLNPRCIKHFVAALQNLYPDRITLPANSPDKALTQTRAKTPVSKIHPVLPLENTESSSRNSISISLVNGNINEQMAGVIVNSTSTDLDLANGAVSKSILETGGPSLQSELKTEYPHGIQHWDIAVTSGANLLCEKVYHTSLSSWSSEQSKSDNAELLKQLVQRCLNKASESSYTSIAFPALGTGNLGYPRNVVAQTMYSAVRDFEQRNGSLSDVIFVVYPGDKETVEAFKMYEQSNGGATFEPSNLSARQPRTLHLQEEEEEESEETILAEHPQHSLRDIFKIDLVKGEINKQTADVIVNSVAQNLDLKNGTIARYILKSGGDKLQREQRLNYPDGIQTGEIAVTSGGRLKCKEVYHVCLPSWSQFSHQQFLNDRIQNCLRKASNSGYTSIAFPALGTGNLGYPKDVAARTIYAAVANFQPRNETIEEVKIVVYPKDTAVFQAFEDCNKMRTSVGSLPLPDLVTVNSQGNDADRLQIGRISIDVKQGDITKEKVDCIVNSTNTDLDLSSGGVSNAIAKACGEELKAQCLKKLAEMKKNGVIITTAAGLNCKYVMHVAGDHFDSNWKSVTLACLQEAEKLGNVHSVAFPLMGTGVRNVTPKDMATIMVQAVEQFESQAINVRNIMVIVFQQSMFAPFINQMKESVSSFGKPHKVTSNPGKVPVSPGSVDLYVFSDDMKWINKAILNLEMKCDKELKSQLLKDPVIKKLTNDQIRRLKTNFDVELVVDKTQGSIEITGLAAEVGRTLLEVTNYVRDIEKEEGESERAILLSRSVQWRYFENNNVKDFDKKQNAHLEKKFASRAKDCKVEVPKGKLHIDFCSMQGQYSGKTETVNIIRRDIFQEAAGSISHLPDTWQSMADDVNFVSCDLPSDHPEYNEVEQLFKQTMTGYPSANLVNVARVQNRALYQQYTVRKKQLEKQNPLGTQNERRLWHGTSPDTTDSINNHGFNRSYCGKNATAYGQGVYFAVNANYSASDTYSRPDAQGHKNMYLAKVLTGVFDIGTYGMRDTPPKPRGKGAHDLCDSVVDNVQSPSMFVVFKDAQAYPEYLLTFTV